MRRPFRRYSYHLAERLGYSLRRLYSEMSSTDILEWMAYDKTSNPDWVKKYERDLELEKSKEMSVEDRVAAFKQMFGGVNKNKDGHGNNSKLNSRN